MALHSVIDQLMKLPGARRYIACAAIFSFALNLLTLSVPLYTIQLYDRVLYSGSIPTLALLTLAIALALVTTAVLDGVRAWLLIALGSYFDAYFSSRFFTAFSGRSAVRYDRENNCTARDFDAVRNLIGGGGLLAVFDLPWTPIFVVACWALHPTLAIVTVAALAIVIVLAVLNHVVVDKPLLRASSLAESSYRLADTISHSAETVRSMGLQPGLQARWQTIHFAAVAEQARASYGNAAVASAMKLARFGVQVAILATGTWLAVEKEISAGALFAASLLCTRAIIPVDQLVAIWRQLSAGMDALRRFGGLLAVEQPSASLTLPSPTGRLAADNLTFAHAPGRAPVISGVTFDIEPGDIVGVVGPSGGGKSTLARLVLGLIAPTAGSIRLDGAETHTWERTHFGRHAGYLAQSIEFFDGTVAENIGRFGQRDDAAIIEAARLACVHNLILSLPDGYETKLAQNGAPLSGGQRQRVALARAVFGNPALLVLDEPNSNLDGEGEHALLQLVAAVKSRGTTVIMIAHRPSILTCVDKILVLANGTLADFGPVDRVMPRIAPGFTIPPRRIGVRA